MSNSATSAAKRRRAGPLLSSPLFQSPQSFQSNNPSVDNNLNLQSEKPVNTVQQVGSEQQPPDSKFMTIQQVINLITTRLIAVENFVSEFSDKPAREVQVSSQPAPVSSEPVHVDYNKIAEICKSFIDEHIAEFDHRYTILAEEIANLKNITLNLQNYTMEVNKTLLEERLQKKEVIREVAKEEDVPNIEFKFEPEESALDESLSDAPAVDESLADTSTVDESVVDKDPFSINIVSKKDKKDKRGKNKSPTSESSEELAL